MKILLSILVLLISFNCVSGCSYMFYPEPPLNYLISKIGTIYIGKVISKTVSREKDENGVLYRVQRIKLRVEKTIKGVENEFQDITIAERIGKKDSCYTEPSKLKVGERWVVQKDFNKDGANMSGLSFSDYIKYDRKYHSEYLEKVEKIIRNPVTAIYGQVQTPFAYTSIKDAGVFIEGNGLKLSAKTVGFGEYSFENIPAGIYRVQIRFSSRIRDLYNDKTAIFNEQTQTFNLEYEVSVKTGDSAYYYAAPIGEQN